MAIKILEVFKVTPPPDSPSMMYLPLTFFDLLLSVVPPVDHLFFYEDPLLSVSTLVAKLKHSLSHTLKLFLPFAGNIMSPPLTSKPVFSYEKGDGILLTVAESDDDFYHLSSRNLRESKTLNSLVPNIVGSDSVSPLIAVKVTIFPKKGFCIGTRHNPITCDGKSASLFYKTWASISKFGKNMEMAPVFDREILREQYAKLERLYIEVLRKENGPPILKKLSVWESEPQLSNSVRGTFLLSGFQVKELKELVSARLANYKHNAEINQVSYVSTFVVTYAYLVLCLVKSKTIANNTVRVIFHYDCRARLQPPLPLNYIGNCIGVCVTYFDKEELLGRDGLMMIAKFINTSIKSLENNGALRGAEEWLPNMIKEVADTESMEVFVSGSSRFELQNMDFGWGKPLKTDIIEKGGVVFIEVQDNNGGIEVDLCLNKDEMEKFAYLFAQGSKMMKYAISAL